MRQLSGNAIIIYCGLLLALSAFSVDITLPSLSLIESDLQQTPDIVKMTVTVYLLAFGLGQIFFGPFSDRRGRRVGVLSGLFLYVIGCLISFITPNIEILLIGRFLQGLGVSAGQVIGRAIMRDLYSGRDLAAKMALTVAIFAAGPLIAPLLGYVLTNLAGWRAVFFGDDVFWRGALGSGSFTPTRNLGRNRQTNMENKNHIALLPPFYRPPTIADIFFHRRLHGQIIYLFLANISQLFREEFGVSNAFFAVSFSFIGVGIIVGQIANHKLIRHIGALDGTALALGLLLSVSLLIAAISAVDELNVYGFVALMFLFSAAFSAVFSNATALAIDPHGDIAGLASSFIGFGAVVIGTFVASTLTYWCDGDFKRWAFATLIISAGTLTTLLVYRAKFING